MSCLSCATLASCGRFDSEESRKSNKFVLRDSSAAVVELVGISGDSLIFEPQDGSPVLLAKHYRDIDHVVLHSTASRAFTGVLGMLGGAFAGALLGSATASGGGDFAGLTQSLQGFLIGGLAGLFWGIDSAGDRTVLIDEHKDLLSLTRFLRYETNFELRVRRGY